YSLFFFFNDTATTEIYTLSLHDALPSSVAAISTSASSGPNFRASARLLPSEIGRARLNSSHRCISYAVFCLKKKKKKKKADVDKKKKQEQKRAKKRYRKKK